jgi:hypothetical protein
MLNQIIESHNERSNGSSNMAVRHRYYRGELVCLRRGFYFPTDAWAATDVWERLKLFSAALSLSSARVVLCLDTAALLWGYPLLFPPREIHVAVESRGQVRTVGARSLLWPRAVLESPRSHVPRGFTVRRMLLPDRQGVRRADGIRLTTRTQTLVDCAARDQFPVAVAMLDAALRSGGAGRIGLDALRAAAHELPQERDRQRALEVLDFANPLSESPGESMSRAHMHLLGFEAPLLQHPLSDRHGEFARADYYWPSVNVVGEFDGRSKYLRAAATDSRPIEDIVIEEKNRENRIRRTGADVARWDWAEAKDPRRLEAILLAAGVPRNRGLAGRSAGCGPDPS